MSVLSDMSNDDLEQIYYAASRQFPSSFDGLRAVAEAAVQAARDGQEPVALLADGRRYKVNHTEEAGVHVGGLPVALCGQWVALVDATDNRHMNYTATPAAPVAPEGYALVPMKPTSAMLDRAVAMMLNVKICGSHGWTQYARDLWETMLAAAPSRPGDEKEVPGS